MRVHISLPTVLVALALSTVLAGAAQAAFAAAPGTVLEGEPGSIRRVGQYFGIVPDADPGTRFAPDQLPEAFRQDGLEIVFSGTVGEIPRNVRTWGTPFELTAIHRRDGSPGAAPEATVEAPRVHRLAIVDRAIDYHGGELYRASVAELELCSKSGCFQLTSRVDGGLYDYTVSGQFRGREQRVESSNHSLRLWLDGEPAEVQGLEQGLRDFAMARIYFPFLPFRLNDPSVFKQNLGLVDWQGRKLHKVKVTFTPGSSTDADDEYMYWFDPETGRLEQFAYSYTENGGGLRFRRAIDHRRVGGLLFFDQENLGVNGAGWSVDAIDPEMVEGKMRAVSTIRLRNIRVQPLE